MMTGMAWGVAFDQETAVWLVNQVFVRGTAVLLAAWVATRLLARAPAAARHGLWVLALTALVLGPVVGLAPDLARSSGGSGASPDAQALAGTPTRALLAPPPPAVRPATSRPDRRLPWTPTVPTGVIWLWAGGALALLLKLRADVRRAEALRTRARPAPDRLRSLLDATRRDITHARDVRLGLHPDLRVPAVVGGRRPCILLPTAAVEWSPARLRSALRHELAHVVRHDYALHVLGRVVHALYWLSPVAWIALARLDHEREAACDEQVLAWGSAPAEYAEHLVAVARSARGARLGSAAALSGRRDGIGHRVGLILGARDRGPWTARHWAMSVALLAAVVLGATALAPVQTDRDARRIRALGGLASPDVDVRRHAAWMLGELESAADVSVVEAALASREPEVRTMAAWALGEIKVRRSGTALVGLLHDGHPAVREMAVLALGELQDPTNVEPIVDAVARHPELAGPARWALGQIGGVALMRASGVVGADGAQGAGAAGHGGAGAGGAGGDLPDPELWAGRLAPTSVGTDGTGATGRSDLARTDRVALEAALHAGGEGERAAAALALGRLGDERAVEALLRASNDPAAPVRAAVVWALDEINPSR